MQFINLFVDECPKCKKLAKSQSWIPDEGFDQRLIKFICSDCHFEFYNYFPILLNKREMDSVASIASKLFTTNIDKGKTTITTIVKENDLVDMKDLFDRVKEAV